MLSNAYLLAQFGFDKAEKEPAKISRFPNVLTVFWAKFANFMLDFDEMLSEFRDTSQKMQKYIEICRNLAKSPEISESAEIFKGKLQEFS